MLKQTLIEIYDRDLKKLRSEIEQYSNESDLWKSDGEISNSAGNLCLHLTGNLKHFIGAVLGESGYLRDRDAEFSSTGIPRDDLLSDIDSTLRVVVDSLERLAEERLSDDYPLEVFGRPMTTGYFLTHLTTHFNYHLGQINYHRRLLSGKDA